MKAAKCNATIRRACLVSLLAFSAASAATAAEFEPRISIGISHTDNLALASVDEQDETIYRAEPGFGFLHEGSRFSVDADYLMQAFRYADLGQSEIYHQYDAVVSFDVVRDVLFLEVGGNRTQSIRDPELSIPQSNLPIGGNLQDRDEYFVSPYFQYALGSAVTARGSYRNTWLDYSEQDFQSNENRDAQLSIDNYRRGVGITWALRYDWQRSDYDEAPPWEYHRATAELGYWIGTATRAFASGGKESAWEMPLDPALEDDFWEVGFAHDIGERLSAEFAVGERSFGSSWRGNLEARFQRGTTTLNYSETPTTQGRNRYQLPAFDDSINLEDLLTRPGSAERFIAKRLEWRLDYSLQRTGFGLGLFDEERSDRTTPDGQALGDEEQRGIDVTVDYRVGAKTDLSARASWAERDFGQDGKSEIVRAILGLEYRLGSRTSLTLEYEYAEEDPEGDLSIRDYVANTVTLLLTRTFR